MTDQKSNRGGARKGAGRKRSVEVARSSKIIGEQFSNGLTPLEIMVTAMRIVWERAHAGATADIEQIVLAASIAKDAAPFMHPRLSNIEANVKHSQHENDLALIIAHDARASGDEAEVLH